MISDQIAYLSTDAAVQTPFAVGFRITETLPLDERAIKKRLQTLGVGTLEIKKRGVDIDPAQFRAKLSLKGTNNATLFLTRVAGKRVALLAERF
jgi:hypothetical protein